MSAAPKNWIKQIEKRMTAIGKERDKIDDMISQLSDLRESCDRAFEHLQDARDALSELT